MFYHTLISSYSNFLKGTVVMSGDKSISHRAIIFSSLASGISRIYNLSEGIDVATTMKCFENLGVKFSHHQNFVAVNSLGKDNLFPETQQFNMGNSGTSCRLILGILAAIPSEFTITGDASLVQRPMQRVIKPLILMGAEILAKQNNYLPIKVRGKFLKGIDYTLEQPSAQVKSAIMLASLFINTKVIIREKNRSRDHTENIFKLLQLPIITSDKGMTRIITIAADKPKIMPYDYYIPSDFSSGAFIIAATLITKESLIKIKNVNLNPLRTGFLKALKLMGANFSIQNWHTLLGEPCGDIIVMSSSLKAIHLRKIEVPSIIDELPLLFAICAFAEGISIFEGIEELRYKESDRILAMSTNLQTLGIKIEETNDSLKIYGNPKISIGNKELNSFSDHRIAMACLIMGLTAKEPLKVINCNNINTSFPDFYNIMQTLGAKIVGIKEC